MTDSGCQYGDCKHGYRRSECKQCSNPSEVKVQIERDGRMNHNEKLVNAVKHLLQSRDNLVSAKQVVVRCEATLKDAASELAGAMQATGDPAVQLGAWRFLLENGEVHAEQFEGLILVEE